MLSVVSGPLTSVSPGNLLEMQNLRHHPGLADSETLGVGPCTRVSDPSGGYRYLLKSEDCSAGPVFHTLAASYNHPDSFQTCTCLIRLGWGLGAAVRETSWVRFKVQQ